MVADQLLVRHIKEYIIRIFEKLDHLGAGNGLIEHGGLSGSHSSSHATSGSGSSSLGHGGLGGDYSGSKATSGITDNNI